MPFSPYALCLVRVVAGLLFLQHGLEKLVGFAGARPEATLWGIRGVGGILETVGGPLLALGLFTRPTAFILSGEMAVAYFRSWAPRGFFPIANGGEEATLNAFIFLWLVAAGAGAFSLDAWIERRRPLGAFGQRRRLVGAAGARPVARDPRVPDHAARHPQGVRGAAVGGGAARRAAARHRFVARR